MTEKHEITAVGMDFFETAPKKAVASQVIHATPDQIFDAFEDAGAWTVWAGPIQNVEWTSPKPFGLGTTRTVSMSGGMVGWETFIAWERGKRMAFCFTHASDKNISSFAEDYIVEDLGNGSSRVTWTMAMTPEGISKVMMAVAGPFMGFFLNGMLKKFKSYVEAQVAAQPAA